MMGSPDSEQGRQPNEGPLHEVEISKPFYLGIYPVTVAQFRAFTKDSGYRTQAETEGGAYIYTGSKWEKVADASWKKPGWTLNDNDPVTCISWNDAVAFLKWLSALPEERAAGRTYRLPTEAEWEYSCRGGVPSRTPYPFGNAITEKFANFNMHLKRTSAVGSYAANGFGLHDMIGNVWEWCSDWYSDNYYQQSPKLDPQGPSSGERRVLRGGAWDYDAAVCRSAYRNNCVPGGRSSNIGFRVVLVPA